MTLRISLLFALLFLAACPKPKPKPPAECPAPDAGTTLDESCAGKKDGTACCFGSAHGACAGNRCVAGAVPSP